MRIRVLIFFALAGAALRLLPLGWLHPLQWDEVEFFRATTWVAEGKVPFRDFWEHHTPLQWYVFAPVARFVDGVGVDAIVAMRWAQVPVWIATFWLAMVLMRRAGVDAFARWAALALALCSSFLMTPAIEYRVDTVACPLYLGGLVLALRMHERRGFAFASGVAFGLAVLANMRLAPLIIVTALLLRIVDVRERGWRGSARANWIIAGGAAMAAAAVAFFVATDSLRPLYQHGVVENALSDRYAPDIANAFAHRVLTPFGVSLLGNTTFTPAAVDVGGVALLVLGAAGIVTALRRWRTPDELMVVAILQIANLIVVAAMKFIYNYHFEIVLLLMLPLAASAMERIRLRGAVVTIVAAAFLVSGFASVFRGKELDREYQDVIMREVHARTRPGDRVWDGVGWALRREPAYRFWFLPDLVRQLVTHGHTSPYRPQELPAAVIADRNALVWLSQDAPLRELIARHYLPVWRSLWIPAPNARIAPGQTVEWRVPADGDYRLFASPALAAHPWFRSPLFVGSYFEADAKRLELRLGVPRAHPELGWPAVARLRKGQRIRMTSGASEPLGVMLVPSGDRVLFRQPPPNVTIDAAAPRVTHVPRLW